MGVPAGLVALIALASVPSALTTLKISDAVRAYVQRDPSDARPLLNMDNVLRLDANVDWKAAQLTLSYAPQLTLVDLVGRENPARLALWQGVEARLTLRQPRSEWTFAESASIGQQVVTGAPPVLGAPPTLNPGQPKVDLQPDSDMLEVASTHTSAAFTYRWSPRWQTGASASFDLSGGLTEEDQRELPQQRSIGAGLSVGHGVSPTIQLSSSLTGSRTETSNGFTHYVADLIGGWVERWAPDSQYTINLGAVAWHTLEGSERAGDGVVPAGGMSVSHALRMSHVRATLQAGGGFSPLINPITGDLQNRVYASASAALAGARRSATLSFDVAQTLPTDDPEAAGFVGTSLILQQRLGRTLAALFGGQLLYQQTEDPELVSGVLWLVYVGISAESDMIKL
jgi:hypothetical protein